METERTEPPVGSFDKEFKLMAVSLCDTGKSCKEVAQDLGVRTDLSRRWKRESRDTASDVFPGKGKVSLTEEQKEIQRLTKELMGARLEAEILKRQSAFSPRATTNLPQGRLAIPMILLPGIWG